MDGNRIERIKKSLEIRSNILKTLIRGEWLVGEKIAATSRNYLKKAEELYSLKNINPEEYSNEYIKFCRETTDFMLKSCITFERKANSDR